MDSTSCISHSSGESDWSYNCDAADALSGVEDTSEESEALGLSARLIEALKNPTASLKSELPYILRSYERLYYQLRHIALRYRKEDHVIAKALKDIRNREEQAEAWDHDRVRASAEKIAARVQEMIVLHQDNLSKLKAAVHEVHVRTMHALQCSSLLDEVKPSELTCLKYVEARWDDTEECIQDFLSRHERRKLEALRNVRLKAQFLLESGYLSNAEAIICRARVDPALIEWGDRRVLELCREIREQHNLTNALQWAEDHRIPLRWAIPNGTLYTELTCHHLRGMCVKGKLSTSECICRLRRHIAEETQILRRQQSLQIDSVSSREGQHSSTKQDASMCAPALEELASKNEMACAEPCAWITLAQHTLADILGVRKETSKEEGLYAMNRAYEAQTPEASDEERQDRGTPRQKGRESFAELLDVPEEPCEWAQLASVFWNEANEVIRSLRTQHKRWKQTRTLDVSKPPSPRQPPMLNLPTLLLAGMSILKGPKERGTTTSAPESIFDPMCHPGFRAIAAAQPFDPLDGMTYDASRSCIICPITQQPVDDENPPWALPNGRIYSTIGIELMKEHPRCDGHSIVCPLTEERFPLSSIRKVILN